MSDFAVIAALREDDFKFLRYERRGDHWCAILVDRFTDKEQAFCKPDLITRMHNLSRVGAPHDETTRALIDFPI